MASLWPCESGAAHHRTRVFCSHLMVQNSARVKVQACLLTWVAPSLKLSEGDKNVLFGRMLARTSTHGAERWAVTEGPREGAILRSGLGIKTRADCS